MADSKQVFAGKWSEGQALFTYYRRTFTVFMNKKYVYI